MALKRKTHLSDRLRSTTAMLVRGERKLEQAERHLEKDALKKGRRLIRSGRMLGPGLIAGAADDDDGGVATYSIVGATTGYALCWLMLLSTPMLIVVQNMCARLGNVTRKGLATLISEKFGRKIALLAALVLVVANVGTIAADVAGMSVGVQLLTGYSWTLFAVPLCLILLYVVVFQNFRQIQKALIYLSLVLLAYVVAGFLSNPDWANVLVSTVIPQIQWNLPFVTAAVGLLGTTITPYLFFWQTATEVEAHHTIKQIKRVDFDVFWGMVYSNLISFFIIVAAGSQLFPRAAQLGGINNAPDPVSFIASALKPVAGPYSQVLFAVGLFAAGALAVIVLSTSTAYVVSETLGFKRGLSKKLHDAPQFYGVLGLSMAAGLAVLWAGVTPYNAMYYSQVLSGVLDPLLLVLIVKLASDELLMGEHALKGWWKAVAWGTVAVISLFVLSLVQQVVFPA